MKNFARFETLVGEKVYHFFCDSSSDWNDVKSALIDLMKIVGNAEDKQKADLVAQQKAQAEAQSKAEEKKSCCADPANCSQEPEGIAV